MKITPEERVYKVAKKVGAVFIDIKKDLKKSYILILLFDIITIGFDHIFPIRPRFINVFTVKFFFELYICVYISYNRLCNCTTISEFLFPLLAIYCQKYIIV